MFDLSWSAWSAAFVMIIFVCFLCALYALCGEFSLSSLWIFVDLCVLCDETLSMWTEREERACRALVRLALDEDLAGIGDLTSQAIIPAGLPGQAAFVARAPGVIAGLPILPLVFDAVAPGLQVRDLVRDGAAVRAGERLATVAGPMRGLLTGERTALNFLQRLSGVATRTRQFVEAAAGTKAHILDTRKTTPGWRLLEKYAVRCGGGHNHRLGLFDGILIKDNHLAALGSVAATITAAVRAARDFSQGRVPLEVEVDTLTQLDEALACRPDIILLDNMSTADMREAVRRRDAAAPGVLLEASGGIRLERVAEIAATGVDRISIGGLTHSAPALDIALDYEPA
jgi:nicotinate-nucleotide pyrophosphorylase (carboxylating)